MQLIYSAVARPQGRGKIERFFGSLTTQLLADLPGYLSPHRGRRTPEPVLDITELDDAIGRFICEYNLRSHAEIGMSPRQRWISDGWLPRLPESLEELDGLLLAVAKPRVVQRDGIHFQGLRYLAPTLAGYVGRAVTIRYDPRDLTEIRVFHNDTFLCKAVDPDHDTETVSLKHIQAARTARRKAVRSELNERIAVLATYSPEPPARTPTAKAPATRSKPRLKTYWEDT